MRGATLASDTNNQDGLFQSTLLMRGATSRKKGSTQHYRKISIHAPHARSDCKVRPTDAIHRHFNPRSSCEERHATTAFVMSSLLFQSTLLMRGATGAPASARVTPLFQSPLLMRGATSLKISPVPSVRDFNPRSSCEERHGVFLHGEQSRRYFNPRSSCEERPARPRISISPCHFNPRSSCEERLVI